MKLRELPDQRAYLETYLESFALWLGRDDVTDIYVNRPGELWIETSGGRIERVAAAELDEARLGRFARQVAAFTHQGISREHPLLAATLPDGARIQIIAPPATRGTHAIAIRKHVTSDRSLDDYLADGAFSEARSGRIGDQRRDGPMPGADADAGELAAMLSAAVRARKTILVSGGTSTGKTTFLNALIREIPREERLILIEDSPEIILRHENAVGLIAARSALGEARVTANDLLTASLRMRPDRIILGEVRGDEAYSFLRAINTGHPGSMTSIHADGAARAIEQLVLLVLQTGTQLTREDVRHYVRSTVDIFVHLGRKAGRRAILEVLHSD